MTPVQSVTLARIVKAACPQQHFDRGTPQAWHTVLERYPYAECQLAVAALADRQTFMSVHEIAAEVRAARRRRLALVPDPTPPAALTDRPRAVQEWQREARRAIYELVPAAELAAARQRLALPEGDAHE